MREEGEHVFEEDVAGGWRKEGKGGKGELDFPRCQGTTSSSFSLSLFLNGLRNWSVGLKIFHLSH